MSSIRKDNPYNWIICEGSSERVYFESYFKTLLDQKRLRILPVGGAKEVRKLFEYLELPMREDGKEIHGKIFCLIDTDEQEMECDRQDYKNLKIRRLLNISGKTILVKGGDNRKTPPTEIEDALNAGVFYEALKRISEDDIKINGLFKKIIIKDFDLSSRNAFDWRDSEYLELKEYFDTGDNKFIFAQTYVAMRKTLGDAEVIPAWIEEIMTEHIK